MNDKARPERERELLSALMDGEASEHELRQALRALAADDGLASRWQRYHVAQSALRREAGSYARVDLRAGIAARLDEAPREAGAPAPARSWLRPLASMAVAATVAVVTVFAWQAARPGADASAAALAAGPAAAGDQRVALGPMVMVRADGEELVLPPAADGAAPTAGQDRLNAYLARHAQAASLGSTHGFAPYARVVSLEGEQGR